MKIDDQVRLDEVSEEYARFVEKFKQKKTTDDCYTPEPVYRAVLDYCVERYGIDERDVIRPFWPGLDYRAADYPEGCTVIDNPPFSIISKIVRDYDANDIRYFLFAPYLTNFSTRGRCTHIVTDAKVTYKNGATVNTSFLTSLEPEIELRSDPELRVRIMAADAANRNKKKQPKYSYPPEAILATDLGYLSARGVMFSVRREEARFVRTLDAQKPNGKTMFGGGYLISERAAAERAAAERAAAERAAAERDGATVWELSKREREIVRKLGERREG